MTDPAASDSSSITASGGASGDAQTPPSSLDTPPTFLSLGSGVQPQTIAQLRSIFNTKLAQAVPTVIFTSWTSQLRTSNLFNLDCSGPWQRRCVTWIIGHLRGDATGNARASANASVGMRWNARIKVQDKSDRHW